MDRKDRNGKIDWRSLALHVTGALAILEIVVAPKTGGTPLYGQQSLDETRHWIAVS